MQHCLSKQQLCEHFQKKVQKYSLFSRGSVVQSNFCQHLKDLEQGLHKCEIFCWGNEENDSLAKENVGHRKLIPSIFNLINSSCSGREQDHGWQPWSRKRGCQRQIVQSEGKLFTAGRNNETSPLDDVCMQLWELSDIPNDTFNSLQFSLQLFQDVMKIFVVEEVLQKC